MLGKKAGISIIQLRIQISVIINLGNDRLIWVGEHAVALLLLVNFVLLLTRNTSVKRHIMISDKMWLGQIIYIYIRSHIHND